VEDDMGAVAGPQGRRGALTGLLASAALAAFSMAGCTSSTAPPSTTTSSAITSPAGGAAAAGGGQAGVGQAGVGQAGVGQAGGGQAGATVCRNLLATSEVRAQVLAAQQRFSGLQQIEELPLDLYYGTCAGVQYAAVDFGPAPGAPLRVQVASQDDGSAMQYFAQAPDGTWHHVGADGFPRDPRGCAVVGALPAGLARLWHGCPATTTQLGGIVYLATTGWNAHDPVSQPADAVLSGDSTLGLTAMHWPTWSLSSAVGTGTGWVDDCRPTCASGTRISAPVKVTLTRPAVVCNRMFFTRIELLWTAAVPVGTPRDWVWRSTAPTC
jgi:hypothetical protein